MATAELLNAVKRLKAIADIGLLYTQTDYDKDRYREIREISFGLLQTLSGQDAPALEKVFLEATEYPTAKVDIRALVIKEGKVLMVQELDGRWALPGGWADIGYSPKETAIKECREETGLEVIPTRLLAVFDTRLHPHPYESFYVYKMVFFCEAHSGTLSSGFDVKAARYFAMDELPALSENRILKSQLELVFKKAMERESEAYFD